MIHALRTEVLPSGDSVPRIHLAMPRNILVVTTERDGNATGIQWVEARNDAKCRTRTALPPPPPPTKNYLIHNSNSTEVAKTLPR